MQRASPAAKVGIGSSRNQKIYEALVEAVETASAGLESAPISLAIVYISPGYIDQIDTLKIHVGADFWDEADCTFAPGAKIYGGTPVGVGALHPHGEIHSEQQFITDQHSCPPGDIISVLLVSWRAIMASPFIVKFSGKRPGSLRKPQFRKDSRSVRESPNEFAWKHHIKFSESSREMLSRVGSMLEPRGRSPVNIDHRDAKLVLFHASASYAGSHLTVEGLDSVFPLADIVGGQLLPKVLSPTSTAVARLHAGTAGVSFAPQPKAKIFAGELTTSQLGGLALSGRNDQVDFRSFVFCTKSDGEAELEEEMQEYRDSYFEQVARLDREAGLEMRPVFAILEGCAARISGAVMVSSLCFVPLVK